MTVRCDKGNKKKREKLKKTKGRIMAFPDLTGSARSRLNVARLTLFQSERELESSPLKQLQRRKLCHRVDSIGGAWVSISGTTAIVTGRGERIRAEGDSGWTQAAIPQPGSYWPGREHVSPRPGSGGVKIVFLLPGNREASLI